MGAGVSASERSPPSVLKSLRLPWHAGRLCLALVMGCLVDENSPHVPVPHDWDAVLGEGYHRISEVHVKHFLAPAPGPSLALARVEAPWPWRLAPALTSRPWPRTSALTPAPGLRELRAGIRRAEQGTGQRGRHGLLLVRIMPPRACSAALRTKESIFAATICNRGPLAKSHAFNCGPRSSPSRGRPCVQVMKTGVRRHCAFLWKQFVLCSPIAVFPVTWPRR